MQESTNVPKISEPPRNSRRQKGEVISILRAQNSGVTCEPLCYVALVLGAYKLTIIFVCKGQTAVIKYYAPPATVNSLVAQATRCQGFVHLWATRKYDFGRKTYPLLLSRSKMLEMWKPKAMIKIRIREQSVPMTFSDCT